MCSIYTSNIARKKYDKINFFLKFRGPDHTNIITNQNYHFIHNLLSMTGEYTTQPFIKNDIVCLYNGEIYNFKEFGDYKSDGECLIDLYEEFGDEFVKKLDGEFAINIMDFKNNKIILASDIFRTKPLYYSVSGENFGCSSFRIPLELTGHTGVKQMPCNTVKVFKIDSLEQIKEYPVFEFDLNQHKNHFDDWTIAFENAIKKRTSNTPQKVFIGLSSGYDSGAICYELIRQSVPFKAYSVTGTENDEILQQRFKILDEHSFASYDTIPKVNETWNRNHEFISKHTENFKYTISSSSSDYNEFHLNLIDDIGSNWLSAVCEMAKSDGRKVYLSGGGADEIFSDYGFNGKKYFNHSNFGGLFPDDLSTIFPWNSFYGSSMESYLAKEEYVAGAHGLEARYPYLDKYVVQEFLSLHVDRKNSIYKNVVDNYLIHHNFPFCRGEKKGF